MSVWDVGGSCIRLLASSATTADVVLFSWCGFHSGGPVCPEYCTVVLELCKRNRVDVRYTGKPPQHTRARTVDCGHKAHGVALPTRRIRPRTATHVWTGENSTPPPSSLRNKIDPSPTGRLRQWGPNPTHASPRFWNMKMLADQSVEYQTGRSASVPLYDTILTM